MVEGRTTTAIYHLTDSHRSISAGPSRRRLLAVPISYVSRSLKGGPSETSTTPASRKGQADRTHPDVLDIRVVCSLRSGASVLLSRGLGETPGYRSTELDDPTLDPSSVRVLLAVLDANR